MHLETYITEIIEGKRKAQWVRAILYALSNLFKVGVKLRHAAFDRKLLKKKKVSIPVVSIGNIIAGGTGKTALIEKIGKDLRFKGKLAILSRGYRSKWEKKGKGLHLLNPAHVKPNLCGDEPYLLFKALPDALLFVGKNRVGNAQRAIYHSADLILLDDGMQYRQLHRDLEIVMLHSRDLYGKSFFLPRGYLRDSPKRLAHAHYLFVHCVESTEQCDAIKEKLSRYSSAPVIGTRMQPRYVMTSLAESLSTLEGKKVGVFCGLGKPDSFFQTVRTFGGEVVQTWILPDHIAPKEKGLASFARLCERKKCDLLLCSEKDWVKLPKRNRSLPLPIGWLKAEMEIIAGQETYRQLITTLEGYLEKKGEL